MRNLLLALGLLGALLTACGEDEKKKQPEPQCQECTCEACECNLDGECTCPKCECKHKNPENETSGVDHDHDGPDGHEGGGCGGGSC